MYLKTTEWVPGVFAIICGHRCRRVSTQQNLARIFGSCRNLAAILTVAGTAASCTEAVGLGAPLPFAGGMK